MEKSFSVKNLVYSSGVNLNLPSKVTPESIRWVKGHSFVICGGCLNGKVFLNDEEGHKIPFPHTNCNGLGYRINKTYGKPLKKEKYKKITWKRVRSGNKKGKKKSTHIQQIVKL